MTATDLDTIEHIKLKEPGVWDVILYNDDVTTMDFVIDVLMSFFNKSFEESKAVMLAIHDHGKGVAGTYSYEVALSKQQDVIYSARLSGYPLQCDIQLAE